jgi:hypothetical protein
MAYTRADLRLKIRELVQDFYEIDTVGAGAIDASSETLPVTNQIRFNVGDVLQIGSEQLKVRSLNDDADGTLSVTRGFRLTTAAAHTAGSAIVIHPEFADRAMNQAINSAIADMYPDIWLEIVNESLVTSAANEYTIPSGVSFVRRIQIEDAEGKFSQDNRDWQLIGTKIQFTRDFSDYGRTIRVIGEWFQPQLSDDVTTLEVSDEQAEFIIYKGAHKLLEFRIGPRLKSTEYSAAVNDRAGQPLEMLQMYGYLRNTANEIKQRERKMPIVSYAHRRIR